MTALTHDTAVERTVTMIVAHTTISMAVGMAKALNDEAIMSDILDIMRETIANTQVPIETPVGADGATIAAEARERAEALADFMALAFKARYSEATGKPQ